MWDKIKNVYQGDAKIQGAKFRHLKVELKA